MHCGATCTQHHPQHQVSKQVILSLHTLGQSHQVAPLQPSSFKPVCRTLSSGHGQGALAAQTSDDMLKEAHLGRRMAENGTTFHLLHMNGCSTFSEYFQRQQERERERQKLAATLADPHVAGPDKQHARCELVLRFPPSLFCCPKCWLLPGLCICEFMVGGNLKTFKTRTRVLVHCQYGEWQRCSNTGSVAALSLPGSSEVLLRGYKPHDARLEAILNDQSTTTALLWPGAHSLLPGELQQIADRRSQGHLTVVALDSTWDGALRMKGSYPKDVLQVRLPPSATLTPTTPHSLLRPVRRYRGEVEENGRVSTLEAIAAMLSILENEPDLQAGMLENLKVKVDAACLQKNRKPAYGTIAATSLRERARAQAKELAASWEAVYGALAEKEQGNNSRLPPGDDQAGLCDGSSSDSSGSS